MTKPYSLDLRDRAVARVVAGETVRSVAATLRVGVSSVVKWSQRFRATGSAAPRKMGGYRPRVLIGEHRAWLLRRIASGSDMTLRGLVAELAEQGVKVSYRTVWNFVHRDEAAWRALLDDLVNRGLKTPELAIVDGASGLEKALAALWSDMPVQRGTVHKHRNLLAHAPDRLHEEISADYNDMIYAGTKPEIEAKCKAFIRKWRLKCRAVADSLDETGDKMFTFTRFPKSQWKSIRTSNAIERLHEEFKRRIKTQTVLPSAETAAMLFWALLASGQITMRKVDGWRSLNARPSDQKIDLAA